MHGVAAVLGQILGARVSSPSVRPPTRSAAHFRARVPRLMSSDPVLNPRCSRPSHHLDGRPVRLRARYITPIRTTLETGQRTFPTGRGALAPLLLLVGLLVGIALAVGYGQFMAEETPTAALEDQVVKLRKQIAAPLLNMAASDRAGRTPRQWVWCQHAGATIAPQWR